MSASQRAESGSGEATGVEDAVWLEALTQLPEVRVRLDASLASLTSLRVGGPAQALVQPETPQAACAVWRLAQAHQVPWLVLGGGTNVVVSDAGLPGMVVDLRRGFDFLQESPKPDGSARWLVGAGCGTGRVVRRAVDRGLAGMEVLAGVPGSMGGALIMNAGGHEGEICSVVHRVQVMHEGTLRWLSPEDIGFAYRRTAFPPGCIVLAAEFDLAAGCSETLRAQVKEHQVRRRATQPLRFPNAGSIFKNPPGHAAGRLIETAGCKGWREGGEHGAEVSPLHANFIVNLGQATATQVVTLAQRVQERVLQVHGVALEFEVKRLGAF